MSGSGTTRTKGGRLRDRLFLSNLGKDISKSENLAGQFPEEVARLEKLRQQWLSKTGNRLFRSSGTSAGR